MSPTYVSSIYLRRLGFRSSHWLAQRSTERGPSSTLDTPAGLSVSVSVSVECFYVCFILSVTRPSPAAALANLGRRQLSAPRLFAKIFNNKQPKTPTSTLGLNLRQLVNSFVQVTPSFKFAYMLRDWDTKSGERCRWSWRGREGSLAEGVAAAVGLFRGQRWQRTHDKSCWPPSLLL